MTNLKRLNYFHQLKSADIMRSTITVSDKHLHTCQSVMLAIKFKNVVKMLKISQPVTFLPRPPFYQLEAS